MSPQRRNIYLLCDIFIIRGIFRNQGLPTLSRLEPQTLKPARLLLGRGFNWEPRYFLVTSDANICSHSRTCPCAHPEHACPLLSVQKPLSRPLLFVNGRFQRTLCERKVSVRWTVDPRRRKTAEKSWLCKRRRRRRKRRGDAIYMAVALTGRRRDWRKRSTDPPIRRQQAISCSLRTSS